MTDENTYSLYIITIVIVNKSRIIHTRALGKFQSERVFIIFDENYAIHATDVIASFAYEWQEGSHRYNLGDRKIHRNSFVRMRRCMGSGGEG